MSSGSTASCPHAVTRRSIAVAAVQLVLQHPNTSFDAETICSVICSSKAIRTAAQQAGGPCSSIALQGEVGNPDTLSRVATFARWLPAHAHLLADVDVYMQTNDSAEAQSACNVIDTLLVLGFQQVGSSRVSIASAAPGQQQQQQQQQQQRQQPPVALRSFSSSARHSAPLLAVLPAATLTHLQLDAAGYAELDNWSLSSICRLTQLKCVALEGKVIGNWLSALGALTQLTSLDITQLAAFPVDLQDFPASLMRLQLPDATLFGLTPEEGEAAQDEESASHADLSHLTRLTRLQLAIQGGFQGREVISAKLPRQLLELHAVCKTLGVLPLLGVTALRRLQRLVLHDCKEQRAEFRSLTLMTSLTCLELTYSSVQRALWTSGVWGRLPQLHALSLSETTGDLPDADDLQEMLGDLGEAHSLQRLSMELGDSLHMLGEPVQLFRHVTGLQQLRELRVGAGSLNPPFEGCWTDVVRLTMLTQLTQLAIQKWHLPPVVAVALACNVTQLRWLELVECEMSDMAALPAIGKLTQLQHLNLSRNKFDPFTFDSCLLFLTGLRALTQLQLGGAWDEVPSGSAMDSFWSMVRGSP